MPQKIPHSGQMPLKSEENQKRGVFDNTLSLFMSDNGGNAEAGPSGRSIGDPTKADSSWFCGQSWAYVENTPFRLYKHYNHEGGIASPLIAHWPSGIAAKNEWRWRHEASATECEGAMGTL